MALGLIWSLWHSSYLIKKAEVVWENRQIIRLESFSSNFYPPACQRWSAKTTRAQRVNNKALFFSLRPINSLIGRAPNWGRPGHSFRLLIQVTLIQREQSGPLVRCHVRHWITEVRLHVKSQRRLNVIQITKRHLGLETRAHVAVPAGLLHLLLSLANTH